jgi:hypothetical protein
MGRAAVLQTVLIMETVLKMEKGAARCRDGAFF